MNKEEILHKRFFLLYEQENIELCMQEYADQEMIAFGEWLSNNSYSKLTKDKWLSDTYGEYPITSYELLTKYKEEREK